MKPNFLILAGDGINCEHETAKAFELAGGTTSIVHINDLLLNSKSIFDYQGIAIPGGFSFGDELGSGQLLALKIRHQLSDVFQEFVEQQNPIIGICNGFQVLMKLGILPFPDEERTATLTANESGHFINKWAELKADENSICKWTIGMKSKIELPVRHGEGRVIFKQGHEKELYSRLKENGQIPFTYTEDINGSYEQIAAICDPSGLVMGMMPHPEAFVSQATYRTPQKDIFAKGDGTMIFESIVNYLNDIELTTSQKEARG